MKTWVSMLAAAAILTSGAAQAQEKLKIGLITTLSGPAAVLGQQQRNGFNLALKTSATSSAAVRSSCWSRMMSSSRTSPSRR